MTKRRGGGKTSSVHFPMKSPASKTPQRTFKHLDFIPLSQIKKVADIKESDGKRDLQYKITDVQRKGRYDWGVLADLATIVLDGLQCWRNSCTAMW